MARDPSHDEPQASGQVGGWLGECRVRSLSQADSQALDAWLADRNGGDGEVSVFSAAGPAPSTPEGQRGQDNLQERTDQLASLLGVLEAMPASDPDPALVDRTLDRVQTIRQRERFAAQVEMLSEPVGQIGGGLRQVAAAAAIVLLSLSLLFPFLERNRMEASRLACQANLFTAGQAFQSYAADHDQVLPRGRVRPGAAWWNVGQVDTSDDGVVQSNSAHLYLLINAGLLTPRQLACPTNAHALTDRRAGQHHDWPSANTVSYSYQNQYTAEPVRLTRNPHMALLADKNPLFVMRAGRVAFDAGTSPSSPSRAHGSRGQNVLLGDGSVRWTVRPVIASPGRAGGDNIWLASGIDRYTGTESPSTPDDTFLVP